MLSHLLVHPKIPLLTHPHPDPPLEGEGNSLSLRERGRVRVGIFIILCEPGTHGCFTLNNLLSSIHNSTAYNRVTNLSSHLPTIKWRILALRFKITSLYDPYCIRVYHRYICNLTHANIAFADPEYPGRIYRHLYYYVPQG